MLESLSYLDWISPLWAWIDDLRYGPGVVFALYGGPPDGWSGKEIQRYLQKHGIRVWGMFFVGKDLTFTVKEQQSRWAHYLLRKAGVMS